VQALGLALRQPPSAAGDLGAAPDARRALIEAYAPNQALLARARAWAVLLGAALLEAGLANSPRHAAVGAATLRRLARSAGP
jgi:hypothetical protein